MTKLKSAVLYEYLTKVRAIGIFYLIQYLIVALIFAIVAICTEGKETGSNALEFSSVVFVSVIGVLGYKEDFKALLQNGYTRNSLHYFNDNYFTLYGGLYGYGNVFTNWLWLTALYLMFCSLFYLAVLVINRVGKTVSLLIGDGVCSIILLVIALFQFVFSDELVRNIGEFMMKATGFMSDGTTNLFFPILSFLVIGVAFGIGSYAVIRRTELR